MKNVLQNFYLFSKLSLSISLLLILILLGYLFYRSYSSISAQENTEVTENIDLLNSINLNSSRIEKIELLLNENNSKLIDIIDTLKSSKQSDESSLVLKDVLNDFNNIKLELKELQNNLKKNETAEKQPVLTNDNNITKTNTAQLIQYKFENGQDYSKELQLLSRILGSENNHIIEKLYLVNNSRFLGNKILISNYKKEIDVYISNTIIKSNKIIDTILPYIKIEPSKNKKLSDSRLITIDNISQEIENKNYSKSINLINSIDKDKMFFKLTAEQLSIAVDFNKTLGEILKNG